MRLANSADVAACKAIAEQYRAVLGFLPRAVFAEAAERGRLLVAVDGDGAVTGFLRFNHRARGTETALYDICVDGERQRCGIGRSLVDALGAACRSVGHSAIALRCPEGLPANDFYAALGFRAVGIEAGRRRRLLLWRLDL